MAWSGLFDNVHGDGHSLLVDRTSLKRGMARLFRERGMYTTGELLDTLIGSAAGGTAAYSHYQKTAEQGQQSAVATIAAKELINRATTAADVTALKALISEAYAPASYPSDASGNGGGGKAGHI